MLQETMNLSPHASQQLRAVSHAWQVREAEVVAGVLALLVFRYHQPDTFSLTLGAQEPRGVVVPLRGDATVRDLAQAVAAQTQGQMGSEGFVINFAPDIFPEAQAGEYVGSGVAESVRWEWSATQGTWYTSLAYPSTAAQAGTVLRFLCHASQVLEHLKADSGETLEAVDILPASERVTVLDTWNATETETPRLMFADMFEQQAAKTPQKRALMFDDQTLTFAEVHAQVETLAQALVQAGVGPEKPVGVYLTRSPRSVIALLAIFRAGGAYVPLDLSYPPEHIRYILEETKVSVVVTESDKIKDLPSGLHTLAMDALTVAPAAPVPASPARPENLALIMYTSGSTGVPKGVALEHRSVMNRFHWLWTNYGFAPGEVACQRTTVNFIPSVWEMLGPILKGVPSVILPDAVVKDPVRLISALARQRVTRIAVVPTLLRVLLDVEPRLGETLPDLKLWFTAGEPLPFELYQRFRRQVPNAVLHNDYGATEVNGVVAFDSRWDDGTLTYVPIGRPIANAKLYILDGRRQPVPVGVKGELFVAGAPVSRGYFGRPDLTQERFFPNPFSPEQSATMYNLGDVARYHPSGLIEVVGRRDHQVKIQGKRVELGGIEKSIARYPGINHAAVVVQTRDSGSRVLTAFVSPVFSGDEALAAFQAFLRAQLPEYMVPTVVVSLETLPLTPNGKKDRKAMERWRAPETVSQGGAPLSGTVSLEHVRDRLREQLARLLRRTLTPREDEMSFTQLGLNSIDAVAWMAEINQTFGCALSVTALYDHFTLNQLSVRLSQGGDLAPTPVPKSAPVGVERGESVAIIGYAGRFPGAENADQLWEMLKQGQTAIREVDAQRWNVAEHFSEDRAQTNKSYSRWGGFMARVAEFDEAFFNLTPPEAFLMDPQQRVALEESWHAMEHAGYARLAGAPQSVGVFVGVRGNEYYQKLKAKGIDVSSGVLTGNDAAMLAGRISHALNLTGPCYALDTACSSSLVAVHLGAQAIRAGECAMALAGGVSVLVGEENFVLSSQAGMLSPTGKAQAFSESADGFVLAEGAGFVVLKNLARAQADGDRIYGILKGSGVNHSGSSGGISTPSKEAQKTLVREVLERSHVAPESIRYLETHGTGTLLGDIMEVEALNEVYRPSAPQKKHCALGAMKNNLGHATTASGILSLIKVLLCLEHEELLPERAVSAVSPLLRLDETPFYLNRESRPWPAEAGVPRRAALSALGYNGTNAHAVVEAFASTPIATRNALKSYVVPFSAPTMTSLRAYVKTLQQWLGMQAGRVELADLAYTLTCRREFLAERMAFVVESLAELSSALDIYVQLLPVKLPEAPDADAAWPAVAQVLATAPKTLTPEQLSLMALRYRQHQDVDLAAQFRTGMHTTVGLPGLVFEGHAYWVPENAITVPALGAGAATPARPRAVGRASETERVIMDIWKTTLGLSAVDSGDRFMDLGGKSKDMLPVHNKIQEAFGVRLSIVDMFFLHATVRSLAEHIDKLRQGTHAVTDLLSERPSLKSGGGQSLREKRLEARRKLLG